MLPSEERYEPRRNFGFGNLKKTAIITASVFVACLGLAFLFSYYTNSIIGSMLREIIDYRSDGFYNIRYGEINYNFANKTLSVSNLRFSADSAAFLKEDLSERENLYQAHIPEMIISIANVWKVYFKRELEIDGIKARRPDLKIKSTSTERYQRWHADAGSLYTVIAGYLEVFKVDDLEVEHGKFQFEKMGDASTRYEVRDISFAIKNFLLDRKSGERKDKFFYTDDIDIELRNQKLLLKDSIHQLAFKKLMMSTTTSSIEVDSLVLSEREVPARDFANKSYNHYNIYVPEIQLDSVDFKRAYNTGMLEIGRLFVDVPDIDIIKERRYSDDEKDSLNNNLSSLIAEYFNNVQIDSLEVRNAAVDFTNYKQHKRERLTLDSTNILLKNLVLDTTIFDKNDRHVNYEQIQVSVKDYSFVMPDSIHKVSFSKLSGSSYSQTLAIEDVRLEPRSDVNIRTLLIKNGQRNTFQGKIDKIEFQDVYGRKFINEDSLLIGGVTFHRPDIEISEYDDLPVEKDSFSVQTLFDPYVYFKGHIKALHFNKLNIRDGNVVWFKSGVKQSPKSQFSGIQLWLEQVRIDTSSHQRLLASENMDLFVKNSMHVLEDRQQLVKVDSFRYDSFSGNLNTGSFELLPMQNVDSTFDPNNFEVSGRSIAADGVFFKHLLTEPGKLFDTLKVYNPVVELQAGVRPGKASGWLDSLITRQAPWMIGDQLIIENGKLIYRNKPGKVLADQEFSIALNNLKIDRDEQGIRPEFEDYWVELDRGEYFIPNHKLKAEIEHLVTSSFTQTVNLKNLKILDQRKGSKQAVLAHIPVSEVTNVDLHVFYQTGELIFGNFDMVDPVFSIDRWVASKKPMSKKQAYLTLEKIRGDRLTVDNGQFFMELKNDSLPPVRCSLTHFDIELAGMDYDAKRDTTHYYFDLVDDIALKVEDFSFAHANIIDSLQASKFSFSKQDKIMVLEDLYGWHDHETKLDGTADLLKFEGFDIEKLINDELSVENIELSRPLLDLSVKARKDKVLTKEALLLREGSLLDSLPLKTINIGYLNAQNGVLNLTMRSDEDTRSVTFDSLDVVCEKFYLDEDKSRRNKLLAADNLKFSFNDFGLVYRDSLDVIEVGTTSFATGDSTLTFERVHFIPQLPKYEYGPAVGVQTDWLNMTFEKIEVKSVKPLELIINKNLLAKKLEVTGMDIYAFRDKRIPLEAGIYKPMPQERLMRLDMRVDLDSVVLHDGQVTYEEVTENADKTGIVRVNDMQARVFNVTNVQESIEENPFTLIHANGKLMGKGDLEAEFRFDLNNPNHNFTIDATLQKMDLRAFNDLLEPIFRVKVRSGQGEQLTMQADANAELSIGSMNFLYNDLKVSILNKETYDARGMGVSISSFFANTFFIHKNNPRLFFKKQGHIYYERDSSRSIFNYWAKIFFSGIVSSISAKSNKKEIRKYEERVEEEVISRKNELKTR